MHEAHDISRRSKMNYGSSREIQMVITFLSDLRFRLIIYWDARNWARKLLANSNGHNFCLWCMCEAHDTSRRSKMNHGSSWEIQMVITFHSDVWFKGIIYRDARNWMWKLSENSNDHNFWLGCMIEAHDISIRLKMNNGSCRENQMVVTFHSDVRFKRIIYRDTRNWTWKLLENSNDNNFWLGCMIEAHDISRRSKLNNGSYREIEMAITFHSVFRIRSLIFRDAQN